MHDAMLYRNIMVAIDNSQPSHHATSLAIELAQKSGAKITGNHVYAAVLHDARFRQMEPDLPERYQKQPELHRLRNVHDDLIGRGLKIVSDSYLDAFEEQCRVAQLEVERKTPEGRNHEELLKDIRASHYDLVVLGAHGLGRVGRSVLGSVCERLVRQADCDVLVVRNQRPLGEGPLLVAIDGSPPSFAALDVGLRLRRHYQVPIIAVAAYDPHFHGAAFNSVSRVLSDENAKLFRFREQETLHDDIIDTGLMMAYRSNLLRAQEIAAKQDIDLAIEVVAGKPFDAIVTYAEQIKPALLLVGRTGIHRCEGMALGNTAENVVRLADSNVLVVNHGPIRRGECSVPLVNKPRQAPPKEPKSVLGSIVKRVGGAGSSAEHLPWDDDALVQTEKIPPFARLFARKQIEKYLRERGYDRVTKEAYEEARKQFGP